MSRVIAFIGFGEVGYTLAQDLRGQCADMRAYDLKFTDDHAEPATVARHLGVTVCKNAEQSAKGADLIISAVTAAQTLNAATSVKTGIENGAWFFDVNSASPKAKKSAAEVINGARGRYVEASIMSPIHPKRIAAPILLAGPHAGDFLSVAANLGFSGAQFYSAEPGKAAAAKLCRSVMIKGMEALVCESMLSARRYGVEDDVLSSLENLFPHPDWREHARYMISRMLRHGARRAEEMNEAANTVSEAGLAPLMSHACAQRQERAAAFSELAGETDLFAMVDGMLAGINEGRNL